MQSSRSLNMLDVIKSLIAEVGITINQIVNLKWIKQEQIQAEITSGMNYSFVMDEWTFIPNDRFMSIVLRNSKTSFNMCVALIKSSSTFDALKKHFETI